MEQKKRIEDEPDVKKTLTNGGDPEIGPEQGVEGLDPRARIVEVSNWLRRWFRRERFSFHASQKFKNFWITILPLLLLVSFVCNIVQAVVLVQKEELQAILCPSTVWSQHGNWCYFFSDQQHNWDFSHDNCSLYGASLVALDSEEEWAFVKSKEDECWIDLKREKADQPWNWPDGSNVTQFEVRGTGLCGYVSGDMVSSTTCDNIRHWICRKPVHVA